MSVDPMHAPIPPNTMRQFAPYPHELADAVRELRYEAGWRFTLEDIERDHADVHSGRAGGLTFVIFVPCDNSYHPGEYRPVVHYHPVPAATFNRQSWERWLFDRLMDTIRHETTEWFRFEWDDEGGRGGPGLCARRPFAPTHGPGDDPYVLHEYATDTQRRTSFRGELNA